MAGGAAASGRRGMAGRWRSASRARRRRRTSARTVSRSRSCATPARGSSRRGWISGGRRGGGGAGHAAFAAGPPSVIGSDGRIDEDFARPAGMPDLPAVPRPRRNANAAGTGAAAWRAATARRVVLRRRSTRRISTSPAAASRTGERRWPCLPARGRCGTGLRPRGAARCGRSLRGRGAVCGPWRPA